MKNTEKTNNAKTVNVVPAKIETKQDVKTPAIQPENKVNFESLLSGASPVQVSTTKALSARQASGVIFNVPVQVKDKTYALHSFSHKAGKNEVKTIAEINPVQVTKAAFDALSSEDKNKAVSSGRVIVADSKVFSILNTKSNDSRVKFHQVQASLLAFLMANMSPVYYIIGNNDNGNLCMLVSDLINIPSEIKGLLGLFGIVHSTNTNSYLFDLNNYTAFTALDKVKQIEAIKLLGLTPDKLVTFQNDLIKNALKIWESGLRHNSIGVNPKYVPFSFAEITLERTKLILELLS